MNIMKEKTVFIKGIYNYCNRWCERCQFTENCANNNPGDSFSLVKSSSGNNGVENNGCDENESIDAMLDLFEFIMNETGIEMEVIPLEVNDTSGKLPDMKKLMKHPLYMQAVTCYDMMMDWQNNNRVVFDEIHLEEIQKQLPVDEKFKGALEVIRWNRTVLLSKTYRALSDESDSAKEIMTDANGSLKVVLIAIDDLFDAWCALLSILPEAESNILDILQHLTILKDHIRVEYPLAEKFIRPGFDL
jgi:hypothetical protein